MVTSNPSLNSFYARSLSSIGKGLLVGYNPVLNSVVLPLGSAGSVAVRACSALNKVALPAITKVCSKTPHGSPSLSRHPPCGL